MGEVGDMVGPDGDGFEDKSLQIRMCTHEPFLLDEFILSVEVVVVVAFFSPLSTGVSVPLVVTPIAQLDNDVGDKSVTNW